ncbi:MAG: hypothetical protein WBW16_14530 [Bacteroidota bacterium]
MPKVDRVVVTEHILEVRHAAVGSFLDVRGFVADYVRESGFLPHWKIDSNVVAFRDKPKKPFGETAFAGYKSFGYTSQNPPTKNFFQDRAGVFVRLILKNQHYNIPELTRFGCRAKAFLPCDLDFATLNKRIHDSFFSTDFQKSVANKPTDILVVSEFDHSAFSGRISFGPMHKDEVSNQFEFQSEYFSSVGLFLDIDYFLTESVVASSLQKHLKESMTHIWGKIDGISKILGV